MKRVMAWVRDMGSYVQTVYGVLVAAVVRRMALFFLVIIFLLSLIPVFPASLTRKASAAYATIGVRSTSNHTVGSSCNNSSFNVTKPAGTAIGDVMVAHASYYSGGGAITPPSGWVQVINNTYAALLRQAIFYRVVDGTEGASITFPASTGPSCLVSITSYTGVDVASVIDNSGGAVADNSGTSATVTSAVITTTTPGAMVVIVSSRFQGAATNNFSTMSGMTEQYDFGLVSVAMSGNYALQPTAGSFPAKTSTISASSIWASGTIALQPRMDTAHMMLFWDGGGAAPAGWSYVTAAEGRYLRGDSAANYGITGGQATHTHNNPNSVTMSGPSSTAGGLAGNNSSNTAHTHTIPSVTVSSSESNEPARYRLRLIRYDGGVPNIIPSGAIAVFDGDPGMPADGHWTQLTGAHGKYIKIGATAGDDGGSNTHTHALTWGAIGGAGSSNTPACLAIFCLNNNNPSAPTNHTHSLTSSIRSASADTAPPYFQPVLGKVDQDTPTISLGITAIFDDDPGGGWVTRSNPGGDYYHRFMRPGPTFAQSVTPSNLCSVGFGCVGHKIPNTLHTSGPASGSVNGDANSGNTARAGHTHTFTASWPDYTSDTNYIANNEYFLPPYFSVVIAEKVNFILRNYIWYEDNDAVTPTNIWGNPDLTFGQSIYTVPIAAGRPPEPNTELRMRIQILVNGNNLTANGVRFKLQYNATRSGSCTASSGEWFDVGENSDTDKAWRYAASTPAEQAITTSVFGSPVSNVLGRYVKSASGPLNNPGATVGDHVEYDFHVQNYSAVPATQYSFRILETTGTLLSQYGYPAANTLCPTLTTRPGTQNQMRHGNFFDTDPSGDAGSILESGFSWVD